MLVVEPELGPRGSTSWQQEGLVVGAVPENVQTIMDVGERRGEDRTEQDTKTRGFYTLKLSP